jgi:proteic killer suppression protein
MADIYVVRLSKQAQKDLKKIPWYVGLKLESWVSAVGISGLREVKKIGGYHDEPLKGGRAGQRSIRLNKAYRAIYMIEDDGSVHFIEIMEVTKHEY